MSMSQQVEFVCSIPIPHDIMSATSFAQEGGVVVEPTENLSDDCVLSVGGGPVGLMTASVLAFHGVKSVIVERNLDTTKWTKMDLTNVRSMEFFRKLGMAEDIRRQGIPSSIPYTVLISPGLSQPSAITAWNRPSVDEAQKAIKSQNCGAQPLEPYQRISQEVFEAWMKKALRGEPADRLRLHRQGRFWHLFTLKDGEFGGAVICQDEKEIFTVHFPLPPDSDGSSISSEEAVWTVLGGMHEPYPIKIDEILVRSTYGPSIAVARNFAGPQLRVFFAGDSAHQNIPTGGYGMNTGLGGAFDIGWKLAAVINGWGRRGSLLSYEEERRPVSLTNVEREQQPRRRDRKEWQKVKDAVHKHYQENDGENKDLGIEMGYRYKSTVVFSPEDDVGELRGGEGVEEPKQDPHVYYPTMWPGSRAPHVFLKDGSSIFDHLGKEFTLVEFVDSTAGYHCPVPLAGGNGKGGVIEAESQVGDAGVVGKPPSAAFTMTEVSVPRLETHILAHGNQLGGTKCSNHLYHAPGITGDGLSVAFTIASNILVTGLRYFTSRLLERGLINSPSTRESIPKLDGFGANYRVLNYSPIDGDFVANETVDSCAQTIRPDAVKCTVYNPNTADAVSGIALNDRSKYAILRDVSFSVRNPEIEMDGATPFDMKYCDSKRETWHGASPAAIMP
ncbi:hypothetical protein MKZ38_000566 [Zalerion maritima]|uniref:FAD-binding domain-containing protein n=1 Tax=Zalerion maritima TaxID=339359 RepID=A0AAD5RSQ6_9PEZI|nr:hypothetical protein MKZ38_000566 [Zalerion maritima]